MSAHGDRVCLTVETVSERLDSSAGSWDASIAVSLIKLALDCIAQPTDVR